MISQEEILMERLHLTLSDEEDQGRVDWVPQQLPGEEKEQPEEEGAKDSRVDNPDFMEMFRRTSPGASLRRGHPS